MPKSQVTREVDFTVQSELCHDDADPFLTTDGGKSDHPWTKSAFGGQRSPPQAVADPSTVELPATTQGPQAAVAAPVMGGPPVGLGGPGNLSALNKKEKQVAGAAKAGAGRDRVPAPANRKAVRKKSAPPPPLVEYTPNERVIDKWQAGGPVACMQSWPVSSERRPNSSSKRESMQQRENSLRRLPSELFCDLGRHTMPQAASAIDRSCSMPIIQRSAAHAPTSRRPPRR